MIFVYTFAIAAAAALLAAGLHRLVQRKFGYDILSRHNDVAGFIYSAIGVIFAVALGFVVVVVWQRYDTVREQVDREVAAAIDLDHVVAGFPAPLRDEIRAQLLDYAHVVKDDEWLTMSEGKLAWRGSTDVETIAIEVSTFQPADASQVDAHQLALHEVLEVFDARRDRIRGNDPSVPPILWFALISGAAATLAFTYLFGVKNQIAQLLMTATLAFIIAAMFIVIRALDNPFHGSSAIKPDAWEYFIGHANQIQTGVVSKQPR